MFKVRLTVTEALGAMTPLMAPDKLEEQLPRLIPALLNLYKKTPDHYIISKVSLSAHLQSGVAGLLLC